MPISLHPNMLQPATLRKTLALLSRSARSGRSSVSKRLSSTSPNHSPNDTPTQEPEALEEVYRSYKLEDVKRLTQLLVGTHNTENATKEPEVPQKLSVPSSLEEKESYRNPFVHFGFVDALNLAISRNLPAIYNDLLSIKDEHYRNFANPSKNLLDLLLDYPKRTNVQLNQANTTFHVSSVQLPAQIFDKINSFLDSNHSDYSHEIQNLVADEYLLRYSFFDIMSALIQVTGPLNSPQSTAFLEALVTYLNIQIIELEAKELESIVFQLASSNHLDLANLVIANINSINRESDYLESCSSNLKSNLLIHYLASRDFQTSMKIIHALVITDQLCPPVEQTQQYVQLVHDTAHSLNSNFENQRLIFMAYVAPLGAVFKNQPDALSTAVLTAVLSWLNTREIYWFINYVKSIGAAGNVEDFNSAVLNRFAELQTETANSSAAIKLTSLVSHLQSSGLEPLDENTRKIIIRLYCQYGSPIGAQKWLETLTTKLNVAETQTLVGLLTRNQGHDPTLPGMEPEYVDRLVEKLKQSA